MKIKFWFFTDTKVFAFSEQFRLDMLKRIFSIERTVAMSVDDERVSGWKPLNI